MSSGTTTPPTVAGSRASIGFILATIPPDTLSFAVIIPVVPSLLRQIVYLRPADTSFWLGLICSVFAFGQVLCAPIAGGLSDRFGRRPVQLLSLAALGCNALLWCVVPNLFWLLALRIVAGALAGNITAATADIADITPPEKRAHASGLVGPAIGALGNPQIWSMLSVRGGPSRQGEVQGALARCGAWAWRRVRARLPVIRARHPPPRCPASARGSVRRRRLVLRGRGRGHPVRPRSVRRPPGVKQARGRSSLPFRPVRS